MQKNMAAIEKIIPALPRHLCSALRNYNCVEKIEEIRLRTGRPFSITICSESYFLNEDNRFHKTSSGGIECKKEDIERTVKTLCNNSVYAHTQEMKQGYIPAPSGCRVGISGNFSGENLFEFSGINIRISHEIKGAADLLIQEYRPGGILIAGPPSSGKTTILRDAVRQLSNGSIGRYYRISIIDTRGEITGYSSGQQTVDIGINSDIFFGGDRPGCIETALRTFSPEIICFDEVGTQAELNAISQSFNAGVDIITTVHAGAKSDFKDRGILRQLMLSGAVKTVYLLHGRNLADAEIFNNEELIR